MVDREQLQAWANHHVGPDAAVVAVERMAGHSSVTIAFDVAAGPRLERLVLRVVPSGVPRRGSTDVLRQVPLLMLMAAQGVPVPALRWWGEDTHWFGVEYLIVARVEGATLGDVFSVGGAPPPEADPRALFGQAIDALRAVHATAWHPALRDWDEPLSLAEEVDRWEVLLRRADDPAWLRDGLRVRDLLHASAPDEPLPGVVHGDFYSNNWMFDGARLTAVLDWESAFLGPRLLDLGWTCMMIDPPGWASERRPDLGWTPPVEDLVERYGAPHADVRWYRALAGYRMAALTAHYLRLHRSGRRPDDVWELIGESVPPMLARAAELAAGGG
jgi:aminoglycoside phosphotransferase (APT) family kinase protein